MILILDNYDSFSYNLVQYVGMLGADPRVYRNDAISVEDAKTKLKPDGIIISPGPGNPSNPEDFGVCAEILGTLSREIPTLGICLGHQGIGHVYGAEISHAGKIMHGKTSKIRHNGKDMFEGLASPIEGVRYHSLVICKERLPDDLEITASSIEDGEIMGIKHKEYPIYGIQFHPESILTRDGVRIIKNFLARI
ncbi:MAG: aminodeoxychorismate/anthranilate synthase component II [Thaumarchaeota archaeon]|nr:aminodeoxychorismate/anthranilate synthase component II [Nitrososphaerota archaeon]